MKRTEFQLLPFQHEAVMQTVEAIYRYDESKNIFTTGAVVPTKLEGTPKPYLHRIKAITGAGKTPILAAISAHLKDSIILWTTPRGAVIEQTTENLKNKYRSLLNDNSEVFSLEEALRNAAWNRIIEKEHGCTIITTTVASFNQKGSKNLIIHKGDFSPWQQLCEEVKRSIWVFYDEGHNATENQFNRLLELQPKGFILASASPLAADLQVLLPGEDSDAKKEVLNDVRTTFVDTKQVVSAGLLKKTIEIHDLNTGDDKILEAAYQKRQYLENLHNEDNIVACYIVDRDSEGTGVLHGLSIWEKLVTAGADPSTIAVHLSGAEKAAEIELSRGRSRFKDLRATYDKKFGPTELKDHGFKHIIWNLSLEEGWDEPWAYVGYFHGEQANENKVIQRIGRLIRNPFKDAEGLPLLSNQEPLRSVYCYLNTSDDILKSVVSRLQNEMDTSSLEVLVVKDLVKDKNTLLLPPKSVQTIPQLILTFDHNKLEQALFKELFERRVTIREEDYSAEGKSTTVSMDVGSKDKIRKREDRLPSNTPTTIADVVKYYLTFKDSRLTRQKGSVGAWISPLFWAKNEFKKVLNYSSEAYYEYRRRCDAFISILDKLISIDFDNDTDNFFITEAISLINPNGGDTDSKKRHYKVFSFKNAVHSQYNGLNDLEIEVATALDKCGVIWMRNPSRKGYGIPLIESDNSSTKFYPDFIAWKNDEIFFIEAKGLHLIEDVKKSKLTRLPKKLYLAIITKEHDTYKLIEQGHSKPHEENATKLEKLITEFIDL